MIEMEVRSQSRYVHNACLFVSGAENHTGYMWDRHYHVCLATFQHDDVVNCVAFNPHDPETLVSVSDDNTIKVWRSQRRHRQLHSSLTSVMH